MRFLTTLLFLFFTTHASADQVRDGQNLAAFFNVAAKPWTHPISRSEDTLIEQVAVSRCTLQIQRALYEPDQKTVTFVVLTHNIANMAFEDQPTGARYSIYDSQSGQTARLDYRMTPPTAQFNNQTHSLNLTAPLRASIPTAWGQTETFGLGTIFIEGAVTTADIETLLAAFDSYKARYCS